jgi:rSAM/selenodomain-associated transferase 2
VSRQLTIVVPSLGEAAGIAAALQALAPLRRAGHEVIVVDAGDDGTVDLARSRADQVLRSPPGRARQMNRGAAAASGDVLVFLHADTRLPPGADGTILQGLAASGRSWGRFDVRLSGRGPALRVIERLMSWRSRLTGIATGDQAIFVARELFEAVGGFPEIALMEDVALSRRLKREGPPLCLREAVVTSSRRWERHGVLRTVLLMWWLRLRYFFGADPRRLARDYGYGHDAG